MATQRFANIDLLKGSLIILVVVGHILQGPVSENISRYIIYSFHMPVFVGIAGFLFNVSKIRLLSFKDLVSKYLFRVIIPWVIAVIAYYVIINRGHIKPGALIGSFVYPYYHLWFITAFLSWVFMTWAAEKLKIKIGWLLVFCSVLSILAYLVYTDPGIDKGAPAFKRAIDLVRAFSPRFYVFFVFGVYLRSQAVKISRPLNIVILLTSFAGIVLLFFFPNEIFTIILHFVFDLSLLNLVISKARDNFFPRSKGLEWVGVNSLAIYLWHVVVLIAIKSFVGTANLLLFYGTAVAAEILFVLLMAQLTKIRPVNKYILGMD